MKNFFMFFALTFFSINSAIAAQASLFFETQSNVCTIKVVSDDAAQSFVNAPIVIGKNEFSKTINIQNKDILFVIVGITCWSPTKVDFAVTTFNGNFKKTYLKARYTQEEQYRVDLFDGMIEKL